AVIQCNVRDITERRRTEAELREKKHFLQRIAEVTPNILQVFDLAERRSLFTNDNLASQLGFAHEEIQAMGSGVAQTLMHPDDLPRFEAHLAAVRALGDGEVARFEHRMRDRAGQWHWFLSHDAVFARDAKGDVREIIGAASNITEQKNAEEALRNTAQRMALATEASSIGIWERNVRTNRIRWDAQMFRIYGVPPTDDGFVSYETWRSAVHPEDAAHNEVVLNATVRRNGRSAREFRILRADTGECRTIQSVETMRANPGGEPEWMVGTNVDITERKQAERHIQLLMGEVNHRAKNLLSVVQAIARQTALTGDSATFTTRLSDRIQALAAGHDLLVRNRWEGVEVSELVHSQLAHFAGLIDTRVSMNGPPLRLSPSAAQGIGMALHEMGTNAAKYGALSNTTGTVHISWDRKLEPEPVFSMQWVEDGGPEVAPPSHQGFGRSVIERTVEASIDGKVDVEYLKSGFVWKLSAPISTVVEA
ncbi:MAG: PAS domain-containing protein, partial [Alphaproteobacteria bacterium]|nr:PAS domain-containing protein [Alphaproteobacteria bacterium]